MLPDIPMTPAPVLTARPAVLPPALARIRALLRHNTMLLVREPGPMASRIVLPLAFLLLLHPLYEQAQPGSQGIIQAVVAAVVTFSLLAMSISGSAFLTERIWHTWERLRACPAAPAELLIGKVLPVLSVLVVQQAAVIAFGALALHLPVRSVPLLAVAVLAWTLTLAALGAALGLLARSLSGLSACYDIGGMILSSLGGALVPLAVLPGWIRHVAPASPGYWAVSALESALRGDAARTLLAAAVLLAFAGGAGLVAVLRASQHWGRSASL